MESYPTIGAALNVLLALDPPLRTWSLPRRIAHARRGNPNFRSGIYSRTRSRAEHKLQQWAPQVPRLVGQLRAIADNHRERELLGAVATALEQVTPEQLGALRDERPGRKRSKWSTRWFVPDAALANVRAYVRLCRWASRFIGVALGGFSRVLRSVLHLAAPVAPRALRLPQNQPSPHPTAAPERTEAAAERGWEAVAARIGRLIDHDVGGTTSPATT